MGQVSSQQQILLEGEQTTWGQMGFGGPAEVAPA